jgi:hypothetical protein
MCGRPVPETCSHLPKLQVGGEVSGTCDTQAGLDEMQSVTARRAGRHGVYEGCGRLVHINLSADRCAGCWRGVRWLGGARRFGVLIGAGVSWEVGVRPVVVSW